MDTPIKNRTKYDIIQDLMLFIAHTVPENNPDGPEFWFSYSIDKKIFVKLGGDATNCPHGAVNCNISYRPRGKIGRIQAYFLPKGDMNLHEIIRGDETLEDIILEFAKIAYKRNMADNAWAYLLDNGPTELIKNNQMVYYKKVGK